VLVRHHWSYFNPVRVVSSRLGELEPLISGQRILIVTTPGFVRRGVVERLSKAVNAMDVLVWDGVKPNPDLTDLDLAAAQLRSERIDGVVGLGGGSAIDAAKVLASALGGSNEFSLDELFRQGRSFTARQSLPLLVVPTTAGTGSEVTPFATVWDHQKGKKYSLVHESIYPHTALLDVELTLSLDRDVTLYPALDAISHALESLWNKNCTTVSKAFALQALSLLTRELPTVLREPRIIAGRRMLQEASMLAGLAISQTRTAIAHAISYPLTLRFGMPHGLACSFTLLGLIDRYLSLPLEPLEERIIRETASLLVDLSLPEQAAKFLTRAEGLAELDNMLVSERAGNCSFTVDRALVKRIVEESLEG
jgi:alcohol dehydrogenase